MSKALKDLSNSPAPGAHASSRRTSSRHTSSRGKKEGVSYTDDRFLDDEFDDEEFDDEGSQKDEGGLVAKTSNKAKGVSKGGSDSKRRRDSNAGSDDDEDAPNAGSDDEEDEAQKKKKKRKKTPFRAVINNDHVRIVAVRRFEKEVPNWEDVGLKGVKPYLQLVFSDLWDNDPARAFITEKCNTIRTKDDLQEAFLAKKNEKSSTSWISELIFNLRNPTQKMKTAVKNEAEGRGPLRGLSTEDKEAAKKQILAFIGLQNSI